MPLGASSTLLFAGLSEFLSAATTVSATSMIALKIILVTRESHARYSYAKVIEILVQSAALESLVMIVNCIADIAQYALAASNSNNVTLELVILQISAYASAFRIFAKVCIYLFPESAVVTDEIIQGIAPTLIAFRVAAETPHTEVNSTRQSNPLSRLTFRRSARCTNQDNGVQQTGISTIRFGSTQSDGPVISIHSRVGVDDGLMPSRCRASIEKEMHIIGAQAVSFK